MTSSQNPTKSHESPLLRIPAGAAYLSVGERNLRVLISTGKIPSVRLSARRMGVLRADLDRYIAQQRR